MLLSSLTQLSPDKGKIIIVGSGAVGLYAANELRAKGRKVLVIESGDTYLASFPTNSYKSIGINHNGLSTGRGRMLGGSTNLWGGQLVEFQPSDFNGREWVPGSKWPITYDDVKPYYSRAYNNLGVPQQAQVDERVWESISAKRPDLGEDAEVFLTRWMRIPNMAMMFDERIRTDKDFEVLLNHTAVSFRGENGRIDAVRVVDNDGKSHWIEGSLFIIAAGTVENSRLMLHAADDSAWHCPWKSNQNVGRYFQDHLGVRAGAFHPTDKKTMFKMFCNIVYGGDRFQPKIRLRGETQEKLRMLNVQGFFAFESSANEHLVYLKQFLRASVASRKISNVKDLFRHGIGSARYLVPLMWRYIKDHRIFIPSSSRIFLQMQAEHISNRDSRITLDKTEIDQFGMPRVVLDWKIGDVELDSLHKFATLIRDTFESRGIGKLDVDGELLAKNPKFLEKAGDTYHPTGGTVMGFSEQDGVVDGNQKVFGTSNVYVGGPSTFRTASNANVTFTAIALTTRLVDHLTQRAL